MHSQVLYETGGFLEKNRDPLPSDSINLLLSTGCPLLQQFAAELLNGPQKAVGQNVQSTMDSQKQSVATKFKVTIFMCIVKLICVVSYFVSSICD